MHEPLEISIKLKLCPESAVRMEIDEAVKVYLTIVVILSIVDSLLLCLKKRWLSCREKAVTDNILVGLQ